MSTLYTFVMIFAAWTVPPMLTRDELARGSLNGDRFFWNFPGTTVTCSVIAPLAE